MSRNHLIRHLLSDRELDVLNLIVFEELDVAEIGDRLFITVRTVRLYLELIREKYGTTSTSLAVIRYMKELDQWEQPPTKEKEPQKQI